MRITKQTLEEVVREELRKSIRELNPHHGPDGRFPKASTKPTTYSLSKAAVRKAGVHDKYAGKGVVTAPYNTDNPQSGLRTPNGSERGEKAAGRVDLDGKNITPVYSLLHHDAKYSALQEVNDELSRLETDGTGYVAVSAELLDQIVQSIEPYLSGLGFPLDPDPGSEPMKRSKNGGLARSKHASSFRDNGASK